MPPKDIALLSCQYQYGTLHLSSVSAYHSLKILKVSSVIATWMT